LRYHIFTIIWAIIIFSLSILPKQELPKVEIISFDKAVHVFFFGILSLLTIIGSIKQYQFIRIRYWAVPIGIIFAAFYGGFIELLQGVISDRNTDLYDIFANFIGSLLGVGLFYIIYFKAEIK